MSEEQPDRTTRRLLAALLLAWAGLAVEAVLVRAPWRAFFVRAGVEVPSSTRAVLEAGDAIARGWGLLPPALVLGVLTLPVWLLPGSRPLRVHLILVAAQAALLGALLWVALHLPLALLAHDARRVGVSLTHEREALVLTVGFVAYYALLGVTLAQLGAWVALCRDALRLPRAALGVEALRAAMVAALPVAFAAPIVHAVPRSCASTAPRG